MDYKVPQPRYIPSEQRSAELFGLFIKHNDLIDALWRATSSPYYPWKKFEGAFKAGRFGSFWESQQITAEEAWYILGVRRSFAGSPSPIKDTSAMPFTWIKLPVFEKMLHDFDMQMGGNMSSEKGNNGLANSQRFLRQSLIEEAIASSQLEGAATTRERAKKMFAENRKPINNSEWMIYNNYETIKKIEEEASKYPLSKETLLELHAIMTHHTDLEEDKIGRWRKDSDDIVVKREIGQEYFVAHVPPKQTEIEAQLDKLIDFANDADASAQENFIHPILKAIMIHFWFAYIHPFCDGNGRLSRSLFYWYLLRQKYWLVSYVPISTVIKKSPTQYADAFSFSEQYTNDLTYFIDYNLRKLRQAVAMFEQHVERVKAKAEEIDRILPDTDLNGRQKQVLHHLLGKPEDGTSITQHANFHEVSWLTASLDIKALREKGYIAPQKMGTSVVYYATDRLRQLIE